MQLLISSSDANNYLQIKEDLDSLRLLVEKSELWIQKKKSSKDADKDDKVNRTRMVVHNLISICLRNGFAITSGKIMQVINVMDIS